MHAREQAGHHLERTLGGREPDALHVATACRNKVVQSLEAQRKMATAFVARQRVHLVDDHRVHAAQQRPRGRRGKEQVQRLGRCDQNVRRVLTHGGALGSRRVAGPYGDTKPRVGVPHAGRLFLDFGQRNMEVLVHVDGQSAQG